MKNKLAEILNCNSYYCNREITSSFIIPYLAKNNNYEIVLYGKEGSNYQKILWLDNYSIKPMFILNESQNFDIDFFGIKTIDINSLMKYRQNKNVAILVDDNQFDSFRIKINIRKLERYNFEIFPFQSNYFFYANWRYFIQKNKTKFLDLLDKFNDDISKRIYLEYIRCIIQDDFYRGENDLSSKKYIDESVFKWNNNESILNCGTGLGDNIYHVVYNKKYFNKIYGFESDENVYNLCEKNISLLSEEYRDKIELYNICLEPSYNINLMS